MPNTSGCQPRVLHAPVRGAPQCRDKNRPSYRETPVNTTNEAGGGGAAHRPAHLATTVKPKSTASSALITSDEAALSQTELAVPAWSCAARSFTAKNANSPKQYLRPGGST
jgi:hypothetical protein|eukprot:SAG25_NODE_376_length_8856_cov_9.128354_5_plen_111_part_00